MIKISEIQFSTGGIQRFLLFYSFGQFFSYLICVLIGISIVSFVGQALLDWKAASGAAVLMGFVGALPSVVLARQASFNIQGGDRMQCYAALEDRLIVFGFIGTEVSPRERMYEKKLPAVLRWEKSGVKVCTQDRCIVVSGPYGTLLSLRKYLTNSFMPAR